MTWQTGAKHGVQGSGSEIPVIAHPHGSAPYYSSSGFQESYMKPHLRTGILTPLCSVYLPLVLDYQPIYQGTLTTRTTTHRRVAIDKSTHRTARMQTVKTMINSRRNMHTSIWWILFWGLFTVASLIVYGL